MYSGFQPKMEQAKQSKPTTMPTYNICDSTNILHYSLDSDNFRFRQCPSSDLYLCSESASASVAAKSKFSHFTFTILFALPVADTQ